MSTSVQTDLPVTSSRVRRSAQNAAFSATTLRMWHSYVSAFIAPMIVFFALSGTLQILDLHEAHGDYTPSAFVSAMGRLHKQQMLAAPPARAKRPPEAGEAEPGALPGGPKPQHRTSLATQVLKGLFIVEALALVSTTLLGVWIGVTHPKRARTFWALLAAGTLIPVVLIAL